MTPPAASLWDFALALYAAPGVENVCLRLQDDFQANTNMVLWSCWLDAQNIRLTPERLGQAHERIASWDRAVVAPLRQLRRDLKQHASEDHQVGSCRQAIKSAELEAEKVELDWLEAMAGDWPAETTPLALGENVLHYLNTLRVPKNLVEEILAYLLEEMRSKY